MADTNKTMNQNEMNKQNEKERRPETMKNETGRPGTRQNGLGGDFRSEQGRLGSQDRDKSAIGGGQSGQNFGQFDKNKEETTNR